MVGHGSGMHMCFNLSKSFQKRTEETMCHFTAQHVLTGRLKLAQVLFAELDMDQRSRLGVARDGPNLVERLLYNFLIPSSRYDGIKVFGLFILLKCCIILALLLDRIGTFSRLLDWKT